MHLHDVLHVVGGDLPGRELPPGVGGEGGLQLVQDDAPQPAQGSVLVYSCTVLYIHVVRKSVYVCHSFSYMPTVSLCGVITSQF